MHIKNTSFHDLKTSFSLQKIYGCRCIPVKKINIMLVSLVAIVIWIVLDKIEGNLCFTGNIVGSHYAKT